MSRKSKTTVWILVISLVPILVFGQDTQNKEAKSKDNKSNDADQAPPTPAPTQILKPALSFGLQDGTPVRMKIARTISSADAKAGDTVDFEVLEEVKIGDTIIIPAGGIAWATVADAHPKRRMGRGGKLNVNIDNVRIATGEKVALRAVKDLKGDGNTGKMTGAIVASGILFFPAAPFFLFMKGKDITIPKGTEVTAYINGDVPLDPEKFAPKEVNKGQLPGS